MSNMTLRRKFFTGMVIVLTVSILILFGNRLLGKAARFHYLERVHLEDVLRLDAGLTLVEQGAKNANTLHREDLLKYIDHAMSIAAHVEVESFTFERVLYRMFGFGELLDLPYKDMENLARMRSAIQAVPGTGVTEELALKLRSDKNVILEDSQRFTLLVQEAVSFIKTTVTTLAIVAMLTLAVTLYFLFKSTLPPINEAIHVAERIAQGDLTDRIVVRSIDEFGQLFLALGNMKDNLARIVGNVHTGTQAIERVTSEIAAGNADLSARTESQASALQETAASMEELTATVSKNEEHAVHANKIVLATKEQAIAGGAAIDMVAQTMESIAERSKKVVDIIAVIDGIAFQTNILALNAAVESARAGEQGRGFAVVASEVRALAQRSAIAAKEIKQLIGKSVEAVEEGGSRVKEARWTMKGIVDGVKEAAEIMSDISLASREQSSGIQQVNQAVTSMDQVAQQNAALVEQAAAAAEALHNQAQDLAKAVDLFKVPNM